MNVLSQAEGVSIVVIFGLLMVALVAKLTPKRENVDSFLIANRDVPVWRGAMSIAISWVWAPAIFICSLQAYTNGLPGIFWFTAPNILCFFIFAPFAVRLRKDMPEGYTLPEYIAKRFPQKRTHIAFCIVFFGYQLGAIVINALAGGTLLHSVTGIEIHLAIISVSSIALIYSFLGGIRASIQTDVLQMSMVLFVAIILVPLSLVASASIVDLNTGLGGVSGNFRNLFDSHLAFVMGIPMTISLLSGPFADQMFYQRAFAVKEGAVAKTFIYGGLIFAAVPILLSSLGFIGAALAQKGLIEVSDPQMIAPVVIAYLLPKSALYLFCFMAIAGLCSTMDSAFCAGSSLGAVDLYKKYIKPTAKDAEVLRFSKACMIVLAIAGTSIALLQPKLLWAFLIYGAFAAAGMFPTIFSVLWRQATASGAFWGITTSLLFGTPLAFYANINEKPTLIVLSSLFSVSAGLVVCLLLRKKGTSCETTFIPSIERA